MRTNYIQIKTDMIKQVKIGDRDYPELLKYIPDPPGHPILCRRNFPGKRAFLAVVRGEKSDFIREMASYGFAKKLSEYGIVVVQRHGLRSRFLGA
jgi:predicted Rossmann fold nucleotide-binding protein DprA/Smf involved in DNA uptake